MSEEKTPAECPQCGSKRMDMDGSWAMYECHAYVQGTEHSQSNECGSQSAGYLRGLEHGLRESLITRLEAQISWSRANFGLEFHHTRLTNHIRKELKEIEADPKDLEVWIDVIILALDGAWRAGFTPAQILAALDAKMKKNRNRTWPDVSRLSEGQPIEHVDERGPAQRVLDELEKEHARYERDKRWDSR